MTDTTPSVPATPSVPKVKRFKNPPLTHTDWAVRFLALAVAVLGLLNLWSSLLARGPGRLTWLRHTVHLPLVVEHASRTLIALFGFALLMLARSLARHKRQAWWIALFLTVLCPLPHLAKGLDYEEALICLLLAAFLLIYRHAFYAQNDRPSARQGILGALGLFLLAGIYGPLGYYLLRDKFRPAFTWERAVHQTTHQIFFTPPVRALAPRPGSPRARWFDGSLLYVSLFAFGYGALMLLRPVLPRERNSPQEMARARRLLEQFGGDPIHYFSLLPDKRYLFDTELVPVWGVAYVVMGRIAVALGDPFGDSQRAGEAIHAFAEHCRRHDWSPAFYQVTGRYLPHYRAARLRALRVGEDAVLDLTAWSLKGKAFQDLRTAINKMGRSGIALIAFDADAPDAADVLTQMDTISDAWLRRQKGEEKTFALGQFEPGSDAWRDGRVFLARENESGRVLAFVTFVPIFGPEPAESPEGVSADVLPPQHGWGLDLMRRLDETPNGLMEFLIASSALRFQTEGAQVMSMGLSPLSGSDEPDPSETEVIARGRRLLYERFNHFYAFKGLHAFKEKFGPQWETRYLIYPGESDLAQTIYGVIRAHSPRRGLMTFLIR